MTETLYFLRLDSKIVGVTKHCNFPAEANNKDKVGTFGYPQLKKIIALKPDIVLANSLVHKEIIKEFQESGIKAASFNPSSIRDVFDDMYEIGRICGAEIDLESAIKPLIERIDKIKKESGSKRSKVFYLMSTDPYITPGPSAVQYDALLLAGAQLMDLNDNSPYISVDIESIKKFDPEVILFCGIEKRQNLPQKCKGCNIPKPICQRTADDIITKEWEGLTAVREDRVHPIPCHAICRPGPRMVDGIEWLHSIIAAY